MNDAIVLFLSAKIATFWAINAYVFKTKLEYFCAKVFKLSFEYLRIYSPKAAILHTKLQNFNIKNVS